MGLFAECAPLAAGETAPSDVSLLHLVASRTKNFFVVTNAAGLTIWVNEAFTNFTGYTLAEMLGRTPGAVLQGKDTDAGTILEIRRALHNGVGIRTEILNYKKSGEPFWIDMDIQPVIENGRIEAFVAVETDITDRQRLQAESAQLAEIAARTSNLVMLTHLDGIINWVNDAFVARTGFTISDLAGLTPADLIQGDTRDPLAADAVRAAIAAGKGCHLEVQSYGRKGRAFWVDLDVQPILSGAALSGFAAIAADITNLKQMEHELRSSLAREHAISESRARFLAMVSHQFRTPLAVIRSASDLLEMLPPGDDRQTRYLQQIRTSVGDMASMLDRLLLLRRSEAHVHSPQRRVDLLQVLQDAVVATRRASPQRVIRLLAAPVNWTFLGDAQLLYVALENLLSNAIKYSSDDQPVEIEAARDGRCFTLRVLDRGIGIPPADLDHIFEPFQRGSNVNRIPGTGLGLSFVKRVIEQHSGTIAAFVRPGGGTQFVITLPVREEESPYE